MGHGQLSERKARFPIKQQELSQDVFHISNNRGKSADFFRKKMVLALSCLMLVVLANFAIYYSVDAQNADEISSLQHDLVIVEDSSPAEFGD